MDAFWNMVMWGKIIEVEEQLKNLEVEEQLKNLEVKKQLKNLEVKKQLKNLEEQPVVSKTCHHRLGTMTGEQLRKKQEECIKKQEYRKIIK